MPAGRYFRQQVVLAWIQGDAPPTPPASVWLHLATSAPTATAPGTAPTIGSYLPIEIEPADWAAISEAANLDTLSPSGAITFPAAGTFGAGSNETATHAMLMDGSNPATAEIIAYGALASSRLMTTGGNVVIGAGDLDLTA